ncbi:putative disease resistance protein RGA3 [Nymphaea colorata]|nr:putative disease resistance protein RGA3 [Nymphaea colorata]
MARFNGLAYDAQDVIDIYTRSNATLSWRWGCEPVWIENRQTNCFITEPDAIGREEDEKLVVAWLMEDLNERQKNASVIAVVGMGGLGKSTIAKKLDNSSEVRGYFNKRMWVCVSEKPNLLNLSKKIMEEICVNESGANEFTNGKPVHSKIGNHLKGKRFLLVLDDVWDYKWWNELNGVLQTGGSGSKSWCLFQSKVCLEGEKEEDLNVVQDIGKKIVTCSGLPLALVVTAGLLRKKDRERPVWHRVAHSSLWTLENDRDDIRPIIGLSYMSLSLPLKQSLTYCSVFPTDYEMEREKLLRLWIAEGFVQKKGRRWRMWLRMADLSGKQCIHNLPESNGDLLLLRYVDLTSTRIIQLRNSITKLYDLQVLALGRSAIEKMPERISHLKNLRHLHREQTSELCHLDNLRAKLRIEHLERVGTEEEAQEAGLERKDKLRWLEWSSDKIDIEKQDDREKVGRVWESLKPPLGLKRLEVENYMGRRTPTWISSPAYHALDEIVLM